MPRIKPISERVVFSNTEERRELKVSRLRSDLRERILHKIGLKSVAEDSGLSVPTISKVINNPDKATIQQLMLVCDAAELSLKISIK